MFLMRYYINNFGNDKEEKERYFNAFCVIDGLCEDIPSRIWNPDEDEERYGEE